MPSPPPPPTSSYTNFPILAIAIVGILATAILLVGYYFVATSQSWLNFPRRRSEPTPFAIFTANQPRGLPESIIQSIPITKFKEMISTPNECAVCLIDFHLEEKLRVLPSCSHLFHIDCVDTWLQTNSNCPICRSEIGTDPFYWVLDVPRTTHLSAQTPSLQKKVCSMGDECIDVRVKDEEFSGVQTMRRSISMDSSTDRQLYVAIQEILRRQRSPGFKEEEGRVWRAFFSFGHGMMTSRSSSVLPV